MKPKHKPKQIKLTPEIKAKIRGEGVEIKTSGKMFEAPPVGKNSLEMFKQKIPSYVDELFSSKKGSTITNPNESFTFGDGKITRKQMKHIIEQRKLEGKTPEEIKIIFSKIPEVIENPLLEYPNTSSNYPGSIVRIQKFDDLGGGVAVILDKGEIKDVITAFTKRESEVNRLKNKYGN